MLTWWSLRALATSRSSRDRSSATTSTPAGTSPGLRSPSHSTSIMRVACSVMSDTALAQSERCTLTPRPRVTKPMISSPGTGVQQLARRTSTSSRPSTCTPTLVRFPSAMPGVAAATVAGSCSASSPAQNRGRRVGRRLAPTRGARRSPPAASRDRRSSSSATTSLSCVDFQIRCTGRPSRRNSSVSSSRPASIMSTRRSRLNHWRILLRARGDATNASQSCDGPAVSTFEVKISHVSPLAARGRAAPAGR